MLGLGTRTITPQIGLLKKFEDRPIVLDMNIGAGIAQESFTSFNISPVISLGGGIFKLGASAVYLSRTEAIGEAPRNQTFELTDDETKSGKAVCSRPSRGHFHAPKNAKQARKLREPIVLTGTWARLIKQMMKG